MSRLIFPEKQVRQPTLTNAATAARVTTACAITLAGPNHFMTVLGKVLDNIGEEWGIDL